MWYNIFFKFILVGLLTVLAGEFQVNVLVFGKEIDEYFSVLLIYAFLLALMYLFGKFLEKKVSPKRVDVIYYITAGLFGLALEWFIIGNAPWAGSGAIQAGMFAWWSAVFLIPRIFTDTRDALVTSLTRKIFVLLLIYSVVSTLVVAIVSADLRPALAGVMIALAYIIINFQFVSYLGRNGFSLTFARIFMWFLACAGIVGLIM